MSPVLYSVLLYRFGTEGSTAQIRSTRPAVGKRAPVAFQTRREARMRRGFPMIRFVEWTADGHLRRAAFLGLRSDKKGVACAERRDRAAPSTELGLAKG